MAHGPSARALTRAMQISNTQSQAEVCVVGGGWAGLAAAVEASAAGRSVRIIDAARQLGGRARTQVIDLGFGPIRLDNGQHLMMGAYRETLDLIQRVSGPSPMPLRRRSMWLRDSAGLSIRARDLPAPWHLALAFMGRTGLRAREALAAARLIWRLRSAGWQTPPGETVDRLLARCQQPQSLSDRLWRPLCLSALNTSSDEACAQTLAIVLRDTLGGSAADSDFVLPNQTLGDCLPGPAMQWLNHRGAHIELGSAARTIERRSEHWIVHTDQGEIEADALILALPFLQSARLLEALTDTSGGSMKEAKNLAVTLRRMRPSPISTVYAAWPEDTVEALPDWIMLKHDGAGEWLFDRGLHRAHRVAAIVASGLDAQSYTSASDMGRCIALDAAKALGLAPPQFARTVVEKRATFACTPDRPQISQPRAGHLPALWLAGDYTEPWYPATLESAVRSGRRAGLLAAGLRPRPHDHAEASA
jgi:squalene-associated FAD-dependent desaturase